MCFVNSTLKGKPALMLSSSALLNENRETAGGRAEGSGSTEEERGSDNMNKCVWLQYDDVVYL